MFYTDPSPAALAATDAAPAAPPAAPSAAPTAAGGAAMPSAEGYSALIGRHGLQKASASPA